MDKLRYPLCQLHRLDNDSDDNQQNAKLWIANMDEIELKSPFARPIIGAT